jgi:hypothetical protein
MKGASAFGCQACLAAWLLRRRFRVGAVGIVYYYPSVSAAGTVAAGREVTLGRLNPTLNVNLDLNLKGNADFVVFDPSYVFATPVFGGQFAVSVAGFVGRDFAALNGTLTVSSGGAVASRQGSISDSLTSVGDLLPEISLRWNSGVNNWMVYEWEMCQSAITIQLASLISVLATARQMPAQATLTSIKKRAMSFRL